jgi:hypothetical protein
MFILECAVGGGGVGGQKWEGGGDYMKENEGRGKQERGGDEN